MSLRLEMLNPQQLKINNVVLFNISLISRRLLVILQAKYR